MKDRTKIAIGAGITGTVALVIYLPPCLVKSTTAPMIPRMPKTINSPALELLSTYNPVFFYHLIQPL